MVDYVDPTTGSYGTIRLLNKDTHQQVASYPVDDERTTFGRDTKCNVRLYFHDVDSLHCTLYFDDGKAYLHVSGESGVTVDGNHVASGSTVCLNNGSHFMIWRKLFQFTPPPREVRARLLATPRPKARKALRMSMVNSALILTPQRTSPTLDLRILQSPIRPFRQNPSEVVHFVESDQVAVVEDIAIQTSPFDNEEDLRSLVALEEVEVEEEPPVPISPIPYQFGSRQARFSLASPSRPSSLSKYAEASNHRRSLASTTPVRGVPSPQRASPYRGFSANRTPVPPPRTPRRRSKQMSMHKAVLMRSAHRAHVAAERAREEADDEVEVEDAVSPERVTTGAAWETQNGDQDAEGEDYDDDMEDDEDISDEPSDSLQIAALNLTPEAIGTTDELFDGDSDEAGGDAQADAAELFIETNNSSQPDTEDNSPMDLSDNQDAELAQQNTEEDATMQNTGTSKTPPRGGRGRGQPLGSFYTPQVNKTRNVQFSRTGYVRRTRASVGSVSTETDWRSGGGMFGKPVRPSLGATPGLMEEDEEEDRVEKEDQQDSDEEDQENRMQSVVVDKQSQERELRAKRRQSALAAIDAAPRALPNPSGRRSSIFQSPTKRTGLPSLPPPPSPAKPAHSVDIDETISEGNSVVTDESQDSDTESEPTTLDDLKKNIQMMRRESMARASRLSMGAALGDGPTSPSPAPPNEVTPEEQSDDMEVQDENQPHSEELEHHEMAVEGVQPFTDIVQPLGEKDDADSSMESRLDVDRSLGPFDDASDSEEGVPEPSDVNENEDMDDVIPTPTSLTTEGQLPTPATPRMDGLRNLFAAPAEPAPTPSFVGMRDMFKTQPPPPATPSFDGMQDMFAEPEEVEEVVESRPETPVDQQEASSGAGTKRGIASKIPMKRGIPVRAGKTAPTTTTSSVDVPSSATQVKRSTRRKPTADEEASTATVGPSTRGQAGSATPATVTSNVSTRSRRTPVAEETSASNESSKPTSPSKRSARSKVTPRIEPTVEEETAEGDEERNEAVEEKRRAPSRIARAVMPAPTASKSTSRRTASATKEKETTANDDTATVSGRVRNAKASAASVVAASKAQGASLTDPGTRVKRSTRARTNDDDDEVLVDSMPRKRLRSASVKVEDEDHSQPVTGKKPATTSSSRIATRKAATSGTSTRRTASEDHDKENTPEPSSQESSSSKQFSKARKTPAATKSASTAKKATSTKAVEENTGSSSRSLRSRTR